MCAKLRAVFRRSSIEGCSLSISVAIPFKTPFGRGLILSDYAKVFANHNHSYSLLLFLFFCKCFFLNHWFYLGFTFFNYLY